MVKRGWIKIFEAGIAIIIILGFVLVIIGGRTNFPKEDLNQKINLIIEEVARNESFRRYIIERDFTDNQDEIKEYIKNKLGLGNFNVSVKTCLPEAHCFIEPYPIADSVYTSERIISSNIKDLNFQPKKIKIFIWR